MKKILTGLVFFSLFSCTNNVVFKGDKEVGNSWHTDSLVTFYFEISDTISTYDFDLNIRHNSSYSYQNLYIFIHTTKPLGKTTIDTLNCILADKTGKWKSKGIGDVLKYSTKIKGSAIYESSGKYKVQIEQAMRHGKLQQIEFLKDILSVGICIEKN